MTEVLLRNFDYILCLHNHIISCSLWQILKKLIEQRQQEVQKAQPGLSCFKEGVRCIPVESIPGIRDTGWRPPARVPRVTRGNDDATSDLEVLASQLRTILGQVSEPCKPVYQLVYNVMLVNK